MKNYPTLKTAISNLVLLPITQKHIPFLVELLSSAEIQKTLYRTKTVISPEKESASLARMYEGSRPKEIVYIPTLKSLFKETPIGFVKVKLIDWDTMSCYLSVALLPSPDFRGKGYAKATYDAFFAYLFSLGFLKIYGRTYENNIPTIKLNEATGFRFIGRQTKFVLYPNKTALDALFFERVNPRLTEEYEHPAAASLDMLYKKLKPFALSMWNNTQTEAEKNELQTLLQEVKKEELPPDWHRYIQALQDELANGPKSIQSLSVHTAVATQPQFSSETVIALLTEVMGTYLSEATLCIASKLHSLHFDRYEGIIHIPVNQTYTKEEVLAFTIRTTLAAIRTINPVKAHIPLLSLALTNDALLTEQLLAETIYTTICGASRKSEVVALTPTSFHCAASFATYPVVQYQFLGRTLLYDFHTLFTVISAIQHKIAQVA